MSFLNIEYASPCENVKTNILHCAVFKFSLCGNMRNFPDVNTALCGILLPLIRHYAEISNFLHTVIWCHLCVTMRKIAGAYAATCVFPHYSLYGAIPLLWSRDALLCGIMRAHIHYCAFFQGFCCSCRILVLLVI